MQGSGPSGTFEDSSALTSRKSPEESFCLWAKYAETYVMFWFLVNLKYLDSKSWLDQLCVIPGLAEISPALHLEQRFEVNSWPGLEALATERRHVPSS